MAVTEQDVVVIGAGAAGLMCAAIAGQRGLAVRVLDHAKRPGRKILISGGGRCNFTNYYVEPEKFLSQNPHFCKSALARYTQWDFIALVDKYGISYHEKTAGQLFCDESAKSIVDLLLAECRLGDVAHTYQCELGPIEREADGRFLLHTNTGQYRCRSLVVASGGLAMPRLGATPLAYQLAEQFGLGIIAPSAGLVPFTLGGEEKQAFAELSGVSLPVTASCNNQSFAENLLFTHRGVSGPAILQISSYWQPGDTVSLNLLPAQDLAAVLTDFARRHPAQELKTTLGRLLPKRLVDALQQLNVFSNQPLRQLPDQQRQALAARLHDWPLRPGGTEGYRTAEVTLGGVDTHDLSSKTMAARSVPGLYFIGEAVDVTGWLGGYNFQWAWSSGWVAGQSV